MGNPLIWMMRKQVNIEKISSKLEVFKRKNEYDGFESDFKNARRRFSSQTRIYGIFIIFIKKTLEKTQFFFFLGIQERNPR